MKATSSRIAVSELHLPDGSIVYNYVIELDNNVVLSYYPLYEELANTIWRPYAYEITDTGILRAKESERSTSKV